MPDVLGNKETPIARKEHTCNYCGLKIEKGEKYEKQALAYDGSAYTWKSHIHCNKLTNHFKMWDNTWDEGLSCQDFRESIWCIYTDTHREVKWDRGIHMQEAMKFCIELMESKNK